ncbi:MAG: hypothetical protein RR728_02905 [Oscillospiraceae bacterium]
MLELIIIVIVIICSINFILTKMVLREMRNFRLRQDFMEARLQISSLHTKGQNEKEKEKWN